MKNAYTTKFKRKQVYYRYVVKAVCHAISSFNYSLLTTRLMIHCIANSTNKSCFIYIFDSGSTSKTAAAPMPVPIHMETIP